MTPARDKQEVLAVVQRFLAALGEHRIPVERAYLYGSYVSGKADSWSDIDVAIVTPTFPADSYDFKLALMKIARDIDLYLEPHPFRSDEFGEDYPPAAEIIRTGERIM
jgi:predicted nucleotidyltransferase